MAKIKTPPVSNCNSCDYNEIDSEFYINKRTKTWFYNGKDTGIKAEGTDGTSPIIGSNGNWWIGTQDTGVPAAGSDAFEIYKKYNPDYPHDEKYWSEVTMRGNTPMQRISSNTGNWEVSYDNGDGWIDLGVKAQGPTFTYEDLTDEEILDLVAKVNVNAQRIPAVAPGVLPVGPAGQTRYMEVTAVGSWTYGGVDVGSNADGFKTTFWWDGTSWSNNGSVSVKGEKGDNGRTIEVFNPSKPNGYLAGDTIYFPPNGRKKTYLVKTTTITGENPITHPTKFEDVSRYALINNNDQVDKAQLLDFYDVQNVTIDPRVTIGAIANTGLSTENSDYSRSGNSQATAINILGKENLTYTGVIDNPSYCGVFYLDENYVRLSNECSGVGNYVDFKLTPPSNAVYMVSCGKNSNECKISYSSFSNKFYEKNEVDSLLDEVKNFTMPNLFSMDNIINAGLSYDSNGDPVIINSATALMLEIEGFDGDIALLKRKVALSNRFRYGFSDKKYAGISTVLFGGDAKAGYNDSGLELNIEFPENAKYCYVYLYSGSGNGDISNLELYKRSSVDSVSPIFLEKKFIWGKFNELYLTDAIADYSVDGLNLAAMTANQFYEYYDDLMTNHPNQISKRIIGYGADTSNLPDPNYPIYEYTFNPPVQLPKYQTETQWLEEPPLILVSSGLHGDEKSAPWSTYLFFKQMMEKWKTDERLAEIKLGCRIKIVPLANPWGFTTHTRNNINNYDLNRNFNTVGHEQNETKVIKSWLNENSDAFVFTDYHNSYHTQNGESYMLSDNKMELIVYSSLIRNLSEKWKEKYQPELTDYNTRGYCQRVSDLTGYTGVCAYYAQNVAGISRSSIIESTKNWGASIKWYTAESVEICVDMFANYIISSLSSYNSDR